MCYLITRVKFILFSVSNGWAIWSVDHTSIASNFESNVFKKIWFFEEISNRPTYDLFGANLYKTLESC